MKSLMYISGILGGLLLMISLIGVIDEFNYYVLFLISGLVLILIFIPLTIINIYKRNKKIKSIIKSYSEKPFKHETMTSGKSKVKGWSMNNSPFRERKSGLNWGGGNVHGSNASRGSR